MSWFENNARGLESLGDIYLRLGELSAKLVLQAEWLALTVESDRLLRIVERHTRAPTADIAALSLARIINASSTIGISIAARNSSIIQSEKARAGKQVRTNRRWHSIRCAIVWVCRKQRLKLVASDSFAESIKKDVLEAAKRFGHSDLTKGTSTRSIERHIAALLKDHRLLNAILEECELQGWL